MSKFQVLCQDATCRNGVGCGNRFVTSFSFELITTRTGTGVMTRRRIPHNVFLVEFVGELISHAQQGKRPAINKEYVLELPGLSTAGEKIFIDPTSSGNASRFVNHSCQPNCEYRVFHCGKQIRVGI